MKRLLRMVLSRTFLILILLLLQIILLFVLINYISQIGSWGTIFYAISILIIIYLITRNENPAYKMSWIIPILIFPLFGGLFYLIYRNRNFSKKVIQRELEIEKQREQYVKDIKNPKPFQDTVYLQQQGYPTYKQTKTDFLGSGELMFEKLLEDLKNAKKYIFMEFFIINKGFMWDTILDILKEKAKAGLDVKIIYDDFGSSSLPYRYTKHLKKMGIDALNFNPMRIHLNFAMNYRDHRKIVVIDGNVGYTGGINIGDEYINKIKPFGHWLDAGIRLEGEAVWSLVISFLETYQFISHQEVDYLSYKSDLIVESDGYVAPFSDTPLDKELTTKNIFLSLIYSAKKSIYITTPYLIIDHELTTAFTFAAKSGIDIKIIIPYVPDKKIVFMVTETYVPELIAAGAKVYRYEPGFIHSKMMIIDGVKAVIGTANFDFRSLYLHFENTVYLDHTTSIQQMNAFINETLEQSVCVTQTGKRNLIYKLLQVIFRGFSSIM
ncbi:cardiolipin synthase [Peloplasma aerotolerans]|uniref:Cardiolipin synthase n=1 Tax=Peloplasma aerotolerans TaxID=3044389 RepID=A0AAW6U3P5_9MOLU|nr:cardiolipin synthase [Mariniplasma sp. M4Ah]MDI6452522.1 cardiolipin synthase [Mariniplasma sp. M4Ah]